MIADALLDLSNRPPREDYEWKKTSSQSIPSSSRKAEAAVSASLPSISPPPGPPPLLRFSRSEASLSAYRRLGSESQLLAPITATTATTASQGRTTVPQHPSLPSTSLRHTTTPSNHFATTTNYTINSSITTVTTTTTTDPTATKSIRFVDRVSRGKEEGSVAGGGGKRHTVSTGVSTFLKMDKTRTITPPLPLASSLHHHHNHNHRQITTWVGGGVYSECNSLDETTLISLEKLCLRIEPPF